MCSDWDSPDAGVGKRPNPEKEIFDNQMLESLGKVINGRGGSGSEAKTEIG